MKSKNQIIVPVSYYVYVCDKCGNTFYDVMDYNKCPHCGKKCSKSVMNADVGLTQFVEFQIDRRTGEVIIVNRMKIVENEDLLCL